jgi:uncharacterized coiled-coil DUF342 family protein
MTAKLKVAGTTLERDPHSKGLVETNKAKADEYLARHRQMHRQFADKDKKIEALEEEIGSLKDQLQAVWEAINSMKSAQ